MANHYSRNVPALEAGCAIRVRLVQMIAEFLADRDLGISSQEHPISVLYIYFYGSRISRWNLPRN